MTFQEWHEALITKPGDAYTTAELAWGYKQKIEDRLVEVAKAVVEASDAPGPTRELYYACLDLRGVLKAMGALEE